MIKISLIISLVICFVAAKHEQYDGHAVYNIHMNFEDQIEVLKAMEVKYKLDIWSYAFVDRPGSILVPKHLRNIVEQEFQDAGIGFEVVIENMKQKMDLEDSRLSAAAANSRSNRSRARSHVEGLSFDRIHSLEVVDQYLVDLANAYPETVKLASAGKSVEGRDIKYLKISTTNFEDETKPIVMLQSLLHAREWITLPVSLYAIEKLILDITEQDLVEDVDWIILPVANPDGYVFSHDGDRLWRKNRARGFLPEDYCMGVDLNRNFDYKWGTHSTNDVCCITFHGRGPFSEPETAAIRDLFAEYGSRLEIYLDIHTSGSMFLYGYGDRILPPNALAKQLLGVRMAQAIDAVKWPQNLDYIVGNLGLIFYYTSGLGQDYALAVGTPYSYIVELPVYDGIDGINLGFLVDPDFIEQVGFETWEAIKIAGRWAASSSSTKP